jgi:hypothetical protein
MPGARFCAPSENEEIITLIKDYFGLKKQIEIW